MSHSQILTRLRASIAAFAACCTLVGAPTLAYSQDDEDEGTSGEEAPSGATIVRTRAPQEKADALVRSKFFYKRGRLEIAPRFGSVVNNALNRELAFGLGLTYHFSERVGVEVAGDVTPLSGTSNTKGLARAVLRLLDNQFRLESVDPMTFVTASLIWYPMYGKITPFSSLVVNLDFFFVLGLGWSMEHVEMLAYEGSESCADPGETSGCSIGSEGQTLGKQIQPNHLLVLNLGFGAKWYLTHWLSFRIDGRLYVSWDRVLNYDEDEAAALNRDLDANANRLTCDDTAIAASEKACKVVFPTTWMISGTLGFWAPGDQAARRAAGQRRR